MAERYISEMPNMEVSHEDPAIDYLSTYVKDDIGHVSCTKYKINDATVLQKFKDMRQTGLEDMEKMSERVNCWKLETEDGGREI